MGCSPIIARARFLSNALYLDVMSGDLDADPAVEAAARVLDRVEGDHTAQVARKRLLLTEHLGLALQMSTASGQRLLTPLLERARVVATEVARLWPTFGEPVVPPGDGLTEREREIVELAADGRTSKDIARELGISPRTVDNHLGSAYRKPGIGSRHDLSQSDRHA